MKFVEGTNDQPESCRNSTQEISFTDDPKLASLVGEGSSSDDSDGDSDDSSGDDDSSDDDQSAAVTLGSGVMGVVSLAAAVGAFML